MNVYVILLVFMYFYLVGSICLKYFIDIYTPSNNFFIYIGVFEQFVCLDKWEK